MNKITIEDIVKLTGGELIQKKKDTLITGAATLSDAKKGDIAFLNHPKYKKLMTDTKSSCVIVPLWYKGTTDAALIKTEKVEVTFSKVLKKLYGIKKHSFEGISEKASINKNVEMDSGVSVGEFVKIENAVKIGKNSAIYSGVYIGRNVEIGTNCVLYPNVVILDRVNIGNNVIIHSGAVIGSDGFGYYTENLKYLKTPQVGGIIIDNNVEIGANVTIDRGSPGNTIIKCGTKIDNLVQIAHNVNIGKNCLIVSQVGIAGSTVIGDNAILAGQAGITGHIKIGSGAKIAAKAGVTRDVKPDQLVSGYPAMNHREAKRLNAFIKRLPELFKKVYAADN